MKNIRKILTLSAFALALSIGATAAFAGGNDELEIDTDDATVTQQEAQGFTNIDHLRGGG